ncbi:hypothetical protein [Paenibacillus arenosi]|nr:hypothetical protein [Paenibacillus arenosi]
MKKLVAKIPLLVMAVCLSIGIIHADDVIVAFTGGAPWDAKN